MAGKRWVERGVCGIRLRRVRKVPQGVRTDVDGMTHRFDRSENRKDPGIRAARVLSSESSGRTILISFQRRNATEVLDTV